MGRGLAIEMRGDCCPGGASLVGALGRLCRAISQSVVSACEFGAYEYWFLVCFWLAGGIEGSRDRVWSSWWHGAGGYHTE